MTYDPYDPQNPKVKRWAALYGEVVDVLTRFGKEDTFEEGDFWVHDDYWGYPQVKVYLHNLSLLNTPLVLRLKSLLHAFPGHEIIVAIAVRGGENWPDMGLTIRAHEIIDGLKIDYFPPEFRSFNFEGSRLGTEDD